MASLLLPGGVPEASPAAYLPNLAASLNNLASFLGGSGQGQEALETGREAAAYYRQLAEASPAAYLPDLAMSLNNLANTLSDAGQTDQAEELLAEMLTVFADGTNGIGYLLLIRGLRRAAQKPSG